MKYDYDTCRAMMWKYMGWWDRAFEADDCFSEFFLQEFRLWDARAIEALAAEGGGGF